MPVRNVHRLDDEVDLAQGPTERALELLLLARQVEELFLRQADGALGDLLLELA